MFLDIILIFFIFAGCFVGYKKGLTRILMRFIGLIVALVFAFSLKGVVVDGIDARFKIKESMNKTIMTSLNDVVNNKTENKFYTMIIEKTGAKENISELANNIVTFVLETGAFVAIFVLIMIITFVITVMLDLVCDLPILNSVNGISGMILGGLMTIVKIWIVLAVLAMFGPLNSSIQTYIDSTQIAKFLYYNNYILKFLAPNLKF